MEHKADGTGAWLRAKSSEGQHNDAWQRIDGGLRESATFAGLYRQYAPLLYRYFYRQVGNPQDAEDLMASTFSKALASLERYHEQGRFEAWLFSIARHTLRDMQRRQKPDVDLDLVAPGLADQALEPEAWAIQAEQARVLYGLIGQLPTDQRRALLLRFFGDFTIGEIAARLDRSIGAVKMLVHRAITTLRGHYRYADQGAPGEIQGAPARGERDIFGDARPYHGVRPTLIPVVALAFTWVCEAFVQPTYALQPVCCHDPRREAIVVRRVR